MDADLDPNLALLEEAAARLGPLLDELLLVGGCASGLLVTDPGSSPIRPTLDVDLVVEATTYADYQRFCKRLEARGLRPSSDPDDPICRWRSGQLVIDLMPLEEAVLGFSNRWYATALRSPLQRELPSGATLSHIDAPHFLASKLEAFGSRGGGDHLTSSDLEDVVVVIDGRSDIERELQVASKDLRAHIGRWISTLLESNYFLEALPGHFAGEPAAAERARQLAQRLQIIADLAS